MRTASPGTGAGRRGERVGTAEWNLVTDRVTWSPGFFAVLRRPPSEGPLTPDRLPALLRVEDRPLFTGALTRCLVDGRRVECGFRVTDPGDGPDVPVRFTAEPVMDEHGNTTAIWAMARETAPAAGADGSAGEGPGAGTTERFRRPAERRRSWTAPPPWPVPAGPAVGTGEGDGPDIAARYLPGPSGAPAGGAWYDFLRLSDGSVALGTGDAGPGIGVDPAARAGVSALLVGAMRGVALTGAAPGRVLDHLAEVVGSGGRPVPMAALCCRYRPGEDLLRWAGAGHPAPLVFRGEGGRVLPRPPGEPLGTGDDRFHRERVDRLVPGDTLLLYTGRLFPVTRSVTGGTGPHPRLRALAAAIPAASDAGEVADLVVSAADPVELPGDACLLVIRPTDGGGGRGVEGTGPPGSPIHRGPPGGERGDPEGRPGGARPAPGRRARPTDGRTDRCRGQTPAGSRAGRGAVGSAASISERRSSMRGWPP
ncbi:PP2C family protein-serine/threonine phosphatase [Streptomyces sp. ST2-7A]|uniref:PP2C family protein-serine/threonine phosphatase n=1 Tax=Streptomyces sp. ST2-7A TaxID=2907214 RepID=UPI0027E2B528|nr:PP2C family protein-serine/threonine phosphatase [Streptomyces sp. ST2-7A]